MKRAAGDFEHPWALEHRRGVAHVLAVSAGQHGHPVAHVVLAECHNLTLHRLNTSPGTRYSTALAAAMTWS